jgi:DNA-3-methyladenine glycosylase
MKALPPKFYRRDPAVVAKDMLGKTLVRKLGRGRLTARIVETEAYYGKRDPASRAFSGSPKYVVELMRSKVGRALIYMVHNSWLLNVSAHSSGRYGAVLIRGAEPMSGIKIMKSNRKMEELKDLTTGPGKLTRAMRIDKSLNGVSVTKDGQLWIAEAGKQDIRVAR